MAVKRTRRPRGSLTPDVILEAAEAVAEQGFDALSMRAVAARLEAVPMALYNHFATKEQLVAALLDRVLGRFEPPPETDDWVEDLRAFARAHRALLARHAWAVAPIFSNPSPGLSSVRIGELALRILTRGGLSNARGGRGLQRPDRDQLRLGVVHRRARPRPRRPEPRRRGDAAGNCPPRHFPLTVATAAEWGAYGSDEDYEFVLGRFLEGLAK